MLIKSTALASHLQQGLRSLYVVSGDDPLLTQEAVDLIRSHAKPQGFDEKQVLIFSSARQDWSTLAVAGQSMGLFASKQWLEVRIPQGKPGKEGSQALQAWAEKQPMQDVLTLIVLPRLDKASTESAWAQALMGCGVWVKVDSIERVQLAPWIAQRLAAQGQRVQAGPLGQQALQQFADRVEGNLLAAHQEIIKLGLLFPTGELPAEGLDIAVGKVSRFDPFRWSESVMQGQVKRAQRMLLGLEEEGVSPVLMHWALAEDLKILSQVFREVKKGVGLSLALRNARAWGPREKWIERALSFVKEKDIVEWLFQAHQIDGVIKGLRYAQWPSSPWLSLSVWSLNIAHRLANRSE